MHKISPGNAGHYQQHHQHFQTVNRDHHFPPPQPSTPQQKKVSFDPARVTYQVEYDVPDDRSLRRRLPLWREHWKRSKSSFTMHLIGSVTCGDWTRSLLSLIALTAFTIHSVQTVHLFRDKRQTRLTVETDTAFAEWPAISLCLPSVIPVVQICPPNISSQSSADCQNIQTAHKVFNTSLSAFAHFCRLVYPQPSRPCPQPLQWIRDTRKCFTYFSALSSPSIPAPDPTARLLLRLQFATNEPSNSESVPSLAIHSRLSLPEEDDDWTTIGSQKALEIRFQPMAVRRLYNCRDYDSSTTDSSTSDTSEVNAESSVSRDDCHTRCLVRAMRDYCRDGCLSRLAAVRSDIVDRDDRFCHSDPCNSRQIFANVLNLCSVDNCSLDDCQRVAFTTDTRETLAETNGVSEANVTLWRRRSASLAVREEPRVTTLDLITRIGGLAAFWSLFLWIFFRFVDFIALLAEISDIYIKKS